MQRQVMLMGHVFERLPSAPVEASMISMATEPDLSVSAAASNHRKGIRFRARVLYDGEDFGDADPTKWPQCSQCARIALRQRMGCSSTRVCAASRTDTGVHARTSNPL